MSHPSESWSERISAAESVEDRRELLAEAARWRAQHLNDVPAIRRATFAISRLLALVGDRDWAVGEARQLASLLQTTPEASDEELETVRPHLNSLGVPVPRMQPLLPPRRGRERQERPDRPGSDRPGARLERTPRGVERQDGRGATLRGRRDEPTNGRSARVDAPGQVLQDARRAAASDDWAGAVQLLEGMTGPNAAAIRLYVRLSQVVALPDPAEVVAALPSLRADLARLAQVSVRGVADPDDPLAQLLGEAVPQKRVARIRMIEDFAQAHPERIDELAAASLRNHLAQHGPTAPAPWLVGVVGQALTAGQAPETGAAVAELRAAGSVAVAAYDEWPFERLVRLRKRAEGLGFDVGGMRRGVLTRGEPDDRKLWTLRLAKDGVERMVAVAPHASHPYPAGNAEELAPRLAELCPRTLLLATGSGNAGLRAAAERGGLAVREHDADDDALLTQVAGLEGPPEAVHAPLASPPDQLSVVLQEESPSIEALTEVIRGFRRPDRALRVVHRLGLDDVRTAAVLRAVDAATEPGRILPEGTTLAVLAAARGPVTRSLLANDPSISARFAGPAVEAVADVVKVLLDGGWEVHRVLRGPTRRETQAHPALETFAPAMGGLWRLLVRKAADEGVQNGGERGGLLRKGEVWYLADLPPEGRAGVPLLLLEDWQRAIVAPVDPELIAWWRTLGAADPVGWTGSEGADLLAAVEGFTARADDRGDRGAGDDEAPGGS